MASKRPDFCIRKIKLAATWRRGGEARWETAAAIRQRGGVTRMRLWLRAERQVKSRCLDGREGGPTAFGDCMEVAERTSGGHLPGFWLGQQAADATE